jgi:AcrR family transcriptional regulator
VSTPEADGSQRSRPRRSSAETREHVLAVAYELFYWQGIRGTGVDRVAAAAQIAPTTLYRLFASKDDLVAAYVERTDRGYREWVSAATTASAGSPRERILALFDALADQIRPENCRGCPFLMALAEYPDPRSAVHITAVATKSWVRGRLRELVDEHALVAPVRDPAVLADQLALVMEGVYASAAALGTAGPAARARMLAETLLGGPAAAST